MAVMTVCRWRYDLGRFRRGEFCLKDADTAVAEENEGRAAVSETASDDREAR